MVVILCALVALTLGWPAEEELEEIEPIAFIHDQSLANIAHDKLEEAEANGERVVVVNGETVVSSGATFVPYLSWSIFIVLPLLLKN